MAPLPVTEYQVAWICALPEELAAGLAMLDSNPEKIGVQDARDENTYFVGRIHDHNVVMACLPAGRDGLAAAAIVANDMVRTFPNLRFGLLVGIGGGVPNVSKGKDIRLGDVVVSQPNSVNGGVIQYDKGKIKEGGVFERKGALNSPPPVLLTAIGSLQAMAYLQGSRIPAYLSEMLDRRPHMKASGFAHPGTDLDVLFDSACGHSDGKLDCSDCDKTRLVSRPNRQTAHPHVHYGLIASANVVVKDSHLRDKLADQDGALCVEMEAAGLMNNFPCLVIRGICDYADSHKNDAWHCYAAATAAAYGKELLEYAPVSQTQLEKPVQDFMDVMVKQAQITNEHLKTNTEHLKQSRDETVSKQYQDCRLAFKTSKYDSFKNINPVHAPGTCQWVFQHEKYLRWINSPEHDLLWISADPGCGKSVLSRAFIDHKSSNIESHAICHFFFKDNDEQNSLSKALCALLHQLFVLQPHLIKHAMDPWKQNGNNLGQEDDKLWSILEAAAMDPDTPVIVCVLDALDECSHESRVKLIEKICSFYNTQNSDPDSHAKLKFLVTSRPYDSVQHPFRQIKGGFQDIRLYGENENLQLRTEIDLVIKSHISELADEFCMDEPMRKALEKKLLGTKDRTYLWIRLSIASIRENFRDSEFPSIESIESVPCSVRDAYEGVLQKVTEKQRNIVAKVLLIIVGSRRPLTVGEMALILGLFPGLPSDNSLASVKVPKAHVEKNIREWCGLFVFLEKSKIYLIHQTAKEFLTTKLDSAAYAAEFNWNSSINVLKAEYKLAVLCVDYLCLDGLDFGHRRLSNKQSGGHAGESSDDSTSDEAVRSNRTEAEGANNLVHFNSDSCYRSFLKYAGDHWASHLEAAKVTDTDTIWEKVSQLFDPMEDRFHFCFSVAYERILYGNGIIKSTPKNQASALHMAAMFGHMPVMQYLLKDDRIDLDQLDQNKLTPLIWACRTDEYEAVKCLIAAGSKINIPKAEHTALQFAAETGRKEIVQLLIDNGAEINAISRDRRGTAYTAVSAATRYGRRENVELLLDKGADIFAYDEKSSETALETAAEMDRLEILEMFMQRGAEKHAAYPDAFRRALAKAAWEESLDVVRCLLSHSTTIVNINTCVGEALVEASKFAHIEIIQALLDRCSKSCDLEPSLSRALHLTMGDGWPTFGADTQLDERKEIVRLLLDRGANINSTYREYEDSEEFANVLHTAAAKGHSDLVRMILSAGADVNSQGGKYGTALQVAICHRQQETVVTLIEAGANVNAQGGKYGSALFAAAWQGKSKPFKLLLDHGACITEQVGEYGSLLHAAAGGCHNHYFGEERIELIQILLDRNFAVDSASDWGTPLQCAALNALIDVSRFLIERGADINAVSGKYGTALQAAAGPQKTRITGSDGQYNYTKMVRFLLDNGADVNLQAGEFGTALQAACWFGFGQGVELLLDHGADVNIAGGSQGSALQALAGGKNLAYTNKSRVRLVRAFLDRGVDLARFGPEAKQAAWRKAKGWRSDPLDKYEKTAKLLEDRLRPWAVVRYQPYTWFGSVV